MSRSALVPAVLLLLAGCGGATTPSPPGPPPPPPPPPGPAAVASITFDRDSSALAFGATLQLTATARDAQGNPLTGRTITWNSATPLVATVSAAGLVTSVALGRATIEATADGVTGRAVVGVVPGWATHGSAIRTGRVELPTGSPLAAAGLRLRTSLGTAIVSPTGDFSIPAFTGGPQLAMAIAQTGSPVLMGWLAGATPVLTARTTAEVLAWFDIGAPMLPPVARDFLREQLRTKPEVADLAAAISTALTGSGGTIDVPAVHQARRALRARLVPAAAPVRSKPQSVVLIDPLAPQSGLIAHETDLNVIWLTNQYRRRAVAVVDKTSHVDVNGQQVADTVRVARIDVGGTTGVTGFGQLLADVVLGNLAWAEVENGPIPIPIDPANARKTTYRMRAFGLGAASIDEVKALKPADQLELTTVVIKSIFLDLVFPVVINIVLDGSVAGDRIEAALKHPGSANALSDCLSYITQLAPQVADLAYKGDNKGAIEAIWMALLSSDSFQSSVFELMSAVAVDLLADAQVGGALRAVSDFSKGFLGFIGKVDLIMTATDASLQLWQMGNSRAIETWELVALPSKVKIDPGASKIGIGDIQLLKALILGLEDLAPGASLAYDWSTTGKHGRLIDGMGHSGNQFQSSSGSVSYVPSMKTTGQDQVTVQISRIEAGKTVVVGSATATVDVGTPSIDIQPGAANLLHLQQRAFTVQVPAALSAGATLSYRWWTTGNFGTLDRGQKSVQGAAASVTYTAGRDITGQDDVAVEVLATKNGTTTSLGTDRVPVQVNRPPFTIEPGAAFVKKDSVLRLVARPRGDRPLATRYRWNFNDGTPPVAVVDDSVITHAFTADGIYTVGVDLEDAAANRRLATASAVVTVGPIDTLPIWKITRLELVSITGDVPNDTLERHPNLVTYGEYFYMLRKLEEIAGGGVPGYVHALDANAQLPDCFDFDFDGDKTEQVRWGPWIWIQVPLEIPNWCGGTDRIDGHYPHDPPFGGALGSSIGLGFDQVDHIARFQNYLDPNPWEYPSLPFATVTSSILSGRRFAAWASTAAPGIWPHPVYAVHEIDAQIGQHTLTGTLRFIYQAYLGDDVVSTWTMTWTFDAAQGR